MTAPIDFQAARDNGGDSWDRSDPRDATLARLRWDTWAVALPDGDDAHIVTIRHEGQGYVGECDCKGYKFSSGPCAHLVTLRKAEFIGAPDVRGEPVRIADETQPFDADIERAMADGGRSR